jgi:hypothetical protein
MSYGVTGGTELWKHGCIEDRNGDLPTDEDAPSEEETTEGFDRWRRESALGAVGTGIARGLRDVFAPTQDKPVVVAEVPGEPPDGDERVRVILDPDDPTKSVAIVPERSKNTSPEALNRPEHPKRDEEE